MKQEPGRFFDINKLPKDYGILVFPISMSRVQTGQSPKDYIKFLQHFSPNKVADSKIGAHFVYGDYLYLHSKEKASLLRNRYAGMVVDHVNALKKLISKHRNEFQIQSAFSFQVWNDQYLRYEGDFQMRLEQFKKLVLADKKMVQYLKEDCKHWGKKYDENQINFFLEEHFMFYFLSKGKLRILNEYIADRQKWILWCYPGYQPKSLIYTYQKNFFKLQNSGNKYENCTYDLEKKLLIDLTKIDLETYNYTYNE